MTAEAQATSAKQAFKDMLRSSHLSFPDSFPVSWGDADVQDTWRHIVKLPDDAVVDLVILAEGFAQLDHSQSLWASWNRGENLQEFERFRAAPDQLRSDAKEVDCSLENAVENKKRLLELAVETEQDIRKADLDRERWPRRKAEARIRSVAKRAERLECEVREIYESPTLSSKSGVTWLTWQRAKEVTNTLNRESQAKVLTDARKGTLRDVSQVFRAHSLKRDWQLFADLVNLASCRTAQITGDALRKEYASTKRDSQGTGEVRR